MIDDRSKDMSCGTCPPSAGVDDDSDSDGGFTQYRALSRLSRNHRKRKAEDGNEEKIKLQEAA